MSQVSIVGGYNTRFGSFVQKNKETGEITDLKPLHELMVEALTDTMATYLECPHCEAFHC